MAAQPCSCHTCTAASRHAAAQLASIPARQRLGCPHRNTAPPVCQHCSKASQLPPSKPHQLQPSKPHRLLHLHRSSFATDPLVLLLCRHNCSVAHNYSVVPTLPHLQRSLIECHHITAVTAAQPLVHTIGCHTYRAGPLAATLAAPRD